VAGLSLLAAAGCGYRLGASPCESPAAASRIAVPLFENRSQEPRIENLLTEAFRDRIQALPCVSLSSGKEADALLKGRILSVETYTLAVEERFFAMQYRMRVVMAVSLERSEDGEVLWQDDRLEEEVSFYASSDALLFKDNREEALLALSSRISQRAVDRIVFGF
jgi:hypothetical protein